MRNKGAAGMDGMTVRDLPRAFAAHWPEIERDLLEGRYQPQPVRRVSIPKPGGGGERHLGIPTVFERVIQQAVLQQLQPLWDTTFSEHSYGFRPGRSAHQAVAQRRPLEDPDMGHEWPGACLEAAAAAYVPVAADHGRNDEVVSGGICCAV